MMAHKHLQELLNEDQEPFVLHNYICDRRREIKRSVPKTQLQVKTRKPISENSSFPGSFCKNACFFSFHDSPDVRKSPLFDFSSPVKSPCRRNSDTLFVHVPVRTAALLLEAAMRIQKQSKSKSINKSSSFGFFRSILKRISLRKRIQKREIKDEEIRVSVKDILRWDSSKNLTDQRRENPERLMGFEEKRLSEMGFSCSCNSRLSSVWSETNEEKSLDLETSSSRSEDSEEMEFVFEEGKTREFCPSEEGFCSSPFRFSLHNTPSPGRRTPEFQSSATSPTRPKKERIINGELVSCEKGFCLSPSRFSPGRRTPGFPSPAMSPSRRNKEVKENKQGNLKDCEEEEGEKEQCSPVSVLDPPFNDDDVDNEVEGQEDEEDGLELERSFAIVQRASQHLLEKLQRFERLAELDPIELEKRMMEDEDDDDDVDESDNDELFDEKSDDGFVGEVLSMVNSYYLQKIPADLKKLILDLIAEEGRDEFTSEDKEAAAKRVCRRLDLWKEVDSNTIEAMIESDLRRDSDEWRKNREQVQETAVQMELAIFGLLVEELSCELVY